ncbi:LysR family transcriptional regulator [Janthinobacterium psychrotolerans]|uniref:DNA-binding transcriptional regulator, LysR family n=1 Tax=Janthinobacterium psychrotolerans TaxID=1747903 RepID=A0A1A7C800_9BURK|nr:LysR family transcriptional regulator [Janthinobacterium psychrotolerans]OBV40895.1 DNA-binding transcriptional regulator, LysR family [Janthinobacterium psychrotolerans]
MKLSSHNIELFLAVVDGGSFSSAARALRRSPSAVSMAIAHLEAELGISLFDRGARNAVPTPAAMALLPHARLVAEQLKQLHLHVQQLAQGLESRISLGIAAELDRAPFLRAVQALSQRHPLLDIEVLTAPQDDVLDLLHRGRISACMAFGGGRINHEEQFQLVGSDALLAIISTRHPPGETGRAVYIEELVNLRQIIVASRELALADARPVVGLAHWRTDSLPMALAMVEAGLGWGNFAQAAIAESLAAGRVRRLAFKNTGNGLALPIHLVWMKDRPPGMAARAFLQLLAEAP